MVLRFVDEVGCQNWLVVKIVVKIGFKVWLVKIGCNNWLSRLALTIGC